MFRNFFLNRITPLRFISSSWVFEIDLKTTIAVHCGTPIHVHVYRLLLPWPFFWAGRCKFFTWMWKRNMVNWLVSGLWASIIRSPWKTWAGDIINNNRWSDHPLKPGVSWTSGHPGHVIWEKRGYKCRVGSIRVPTWHLWSLSLSFRRTPAGCGDFFRKLVVFLCVFLIGIENHPWAVKNY